MIHGYYQNELIRPSNVHVYQSELVIVSCNYQPYNVIEILGEILTDLGKL